MLVFKYLIDVINRLVGKKQKSWSIDDAQKLADEYPYTFYKPSPEVISQLKPGNQAKVIFRFESDDPTNPEAERMWVEITEVKNGKFYGCLDNIPVYIEDLKLNDPVEFEARHIIEIDLDDPVPSIVDKYAKRCFVTNNVLYEGQAVGFLYKEDPDYDDDSGWRFSTGTESEEYMDDSNNISYVSLGAVLREDDGFVNLLDREEGVVFEKTTSGEYVEVD